MTDWLERVGYTAADLAALNVIHVAGTKGKGSTCAYVQSLLQAFARRTGFPRRIGLYTSPHLADVRERIQIDGRPISEALFARYFFDVWERLFESPSSSAAEGRRQPRYLQLLVILAIHVFRQEGVHAAIFETHHGGEYDATNVWAGGRCLVTGITSIGLDHLAQLGPDVDQVAWHKAGILKRGSSPAYSAPQSPRPIEAVLRARAAERGVQLDIVAPYAGEAAGRRLPPVQRINCGLAIALANAFLARTWVSSGSTLGTAAAPPQLSQTDIQRGIYTFAWPGRFEIIRPGPTDARVTWYVDGAHNEFSIGQAVDWFVAGVSSQAARGAADVPPPPPPPPPPRCLLIFSHISEERDGPALVRALARALARHAAAIPAPEMVFTTYRQRRHGPGDGGDDVTTTTTTTDAVAAANAIHSLPRQYPALWKSIDATTAAAKASYVPSIEEALDYARQVQVTHSSDPLHVLVTGSLYLVGGALQLLRPTT